MGTALGAIAGDIVGAGLGMIGQNAQNQANAQQAQKQMDFQASQADIARNYNTQMSNTSYQRGVADMRAAGLNPAMAYGSQGASTPTSTAPSGAMATMGNVASAGLSGATQAAQLQNIMAQTDKTSAEATSARADARAADAFTAARLYDIQTSGGLKAASGAKTAQEAITLEGTQDARQRAYSLQNDYLGNQIKLSNYSQQAAGLGIQHEQNLHDYEASPVGKYAPYLGTAEQGMRMFGDLYNAIPIPGLSGLGNLLTKPLNLGVGGTQKFIPTAEQQAWNAAHPYIKAPR